MFNKSFHSDHDAFTVKIEAQTDMQSKTKQHKFAFNKADWKELNNYILENPFKPYCYSNNDELVKQWYTWLEDVLSKNCSWTLLCNCGSCNTIRKWSTLPLNDGCKPLRTLHRSLNSPYLSLPLKHSRAYFKMPKLCSARSLNARICYLARS